MQFLQTIRKIIDENVSRATNIFLFLIIILIPFSVRYVFDSTWNSQTGAYSDFTSLSLYISDLVLLGLILCFMWNYKFIKRTWLYLIGLSISWLVLELILQSRETLPLQLNFSFRLVLLMFFAFVVSQISVSREKVAWAFSILGAIQGLIAILQFYFQKSLGLYYLGESHLSPETLGVAKIVAHGTKFIRGYGTFPHSNLLAAFLVTSTLLNLYLLIKNHQLPRGIWRTITLYSILALNIFGIFVSFSRGGLLALGFCIGLILAFLLIKRQYSTAKSLILPLFIIIFSSIAVLWPYLATRTTVSDNAVKERVFYNQVGDKMIKSKPFLGIGPGTSVLHMKHYSDQNLEPWEIQPIHNYYLISWSEWGIGAILLFMVLLYPFYVLFKRGLANFNEWQAILSILLFSFLALFLLDHYFYTIWPTQLLLWLVVGLVAHETLKSS